MSYSGNVRRGIRLHERPSRGVKPLDRGGRVRGRPGETGRDLEGADRPAVESGVDWRGGGRVSVWVQRGQACARHEERVCEGGEGVMDEDARLDWQGACS